MPDKTLGHVAAEAFHTHGYPNDKYHWKHDTSAHEAWDAAAQEVVEAFLGEGVWHPKALQAYCDRKGIPGPSTSEHTEDYDGECYCHECLEWGAQ